jgi:hypothetical protein
MSQLPVVSQEGAKAALLPPCTALALISLVTGVPGAVRPALMPARAHSSPQVESFSAILWLTSTVRPLLSQWYS